MSAIRSFVPTYHMKIARIKRNSVNKAVQLHYHMTHVRAADLVVFEHKTSVHRLRSVKHNPSKLQLSQFVAQTLFCERLVNAMEGVLSGKSQHVQHETPLKIASGQFYQTNATHCALCECCSGKMVLTVHSSSPYRPSLANAKHLDRFTNCLTILWINLVTRNAWSCHLH